MSEIDIKSYTSRAVELVWKIEMAKNAFLISEIVNFFENFYWINLNIVLQLLRLWGGISFFKNHLRKKEEKKRNLFPLREFIYTAKKQYIMKGGKQKNENQKSAEYFLSGIHALYDDSYVGVCRKQICRWALFQFEWRRFHSSYRCR